MSAADEVYLEARNALLAVIGGLDKRARSFTTPDGTSFRVNRKPPLRLYLLILFRQQPGEKESTSFSFQRNGRVNLGGARKIPLRQAMASGHEPWASRSELLELAEQLRQAKVTRP